MPGTPVLSPYNLGNRLEAQPLPLWATTSYTRTPKEKNLWGCSKIRHLLSFILHLILYSYVIYSLLKVCVNILLDSACLFHPCRFVLVSSVHLTVTFIPMYLLTSLLWVATHHICLFYLTGETIYNHPSIHSIVKLNPVFITLADQLFFLYDIPNIFYW